MSTLRQPLILVVDDEPTITRLVEVNLQREGFRVTKAADGVEALRKVRLEQPDLILLDIMMPGLDGLQVCRVLKADVGTRLIPVIVISGQSAVHDWVGALEAGADDLLEKPFEPVELVARVRSLLRVKSRYDEMSQEIQRLTEIGIALSAERNLARLLERIVDEARSLNHADAGTLYTVDSEEEVLRFAIVQNESMNTRLGGERGEIPWPPVPLNPSNVSAYVALTGDIVNIRDVYEAEGFDFSGPRKYDAANGYRSQSMLVVPMRNHDDEVIGVLQLINAQDPRTGDVVPFPERNVERTRALASQAGIALTNAQLIHDLEALLDGLLKVMAAAVDEKSAYTGGHIQRVTRYGVLLAEAVNNCPDDRFGDRRFTRDELTELRVAGLLHDIGKIVTPQHVVDKATKLQTVYDRIQEVRTRFSVIRRGRENEMLRRKLALAQAGAAPEALVRLDAEFAADCERLADDLQYLESINLGGEFMAPDKLERLQAIAAQTYVDDAGATQPYLTEDEVRNLSIARGTLLPEEFKVIREHAAVSLRLLQQIPFARKMRNVPTYAGDHHEALDGSGYPRGKKAEDLPLQSRILAIADIFDALTASDRPYKNAYSVEKACEILRADASRGKVDPDLVELFISANCYSRLREDDAQAGSRKALLSPAAQETREAVAETIAEAVPAAVEQAVKDVLPDVVKEAVKEAIQEAAQESAADQAPNAACHPPAKKREPVSSGS